MLSIFSFYNHHISLFFICLLLKCLLLLCCIVITVNRWDKMIWFFTRHFLSLDFFFFFSLRSLCLKLSTHYWKNTSWTVYSRKIVLHHMCLTLIIWMRQRKNKYKHLHEQTLNMMNILNVNIDVSSELTSLSMTTTTTILSA